MTVRAGLDVLLEDRRSLLRGRRVALLVNGTSVDRQLSPSVSRMFAATDIELTAVLSPEHGLWGTHQDMEGVPSDVDPVTGVRTISLYGEDEASLSPARDQLEDADVLIFDIQDVGARYYTFVYSLLHAMQIASEVSLPVIVCDRPNPIDGVTIEGNVVEDNFHSFVGRWPLANRHGMTVGELARLFQTEVGGELEVIPMEGWRRTDGFDDTGLAWVPPSPNMPTVDTASVYPGMCLLEGTNLSEGRGTTRPFELFGAPWLDARAFVDRLERAGLPGVRFRPTMFRPMFQKYAGEICGGAQIHILDRRALRSVELGLTVIQVAMTLAPESFRWRTEPYEFVTDRLAIDLLAGTERWRLGLEAGVTPRELLDEGRTALHDFKERRRAALLYAPVAVTTG